MPVVHIGIHVDDGELQSVFDVLPVLLLLLCFFALSASLFVRHKYSSSFAVVVLLYSYYYREKNI